MRKKMPITTRTAANKKARSGYYALCRVSRRLGIIRLLPAARTGFAGTIGFFFVAVCAIIQLTCLYQNISESIIVRTPTTQQ